MPISDDSLPPGGPSLRQAFDALITTLNERGVRYAIIGGLALIQHGRVRTTDDIDALVAVPAVELPGLFEALRARGFDVDLKKCIREFRSEGMTSIRFADVLVDLLQPVIPAYVHVLERATEVQVLDRLVRICSAEGLVVTKLIAMRPQDEADIQDILAAYAGKLDLGFIRAELESFSAPNDPRRTKFEEWVQKAGGSIGL